MRRTSEFNQLLTELNTELDSSTFKLVPHELNTDNPNESPLLRNSLRPNAFDEKNDNSLFSLSKSGFNLDSFVKENHETDHPKATFTDPGQKNSITNSDEKRDVKERVRKNLKKLQKFLVLSMAEKRLNALIERKQRKKQRGKTINSLTIPLILRSSIKFFHIRPEGLFWLIWQILLQFGIIFYALTFPDKTKTFYSDKAIDVINVLIDVYYLFYIFLRFFLAIKLPDGSLIYDKKAIATKYVIPDSFGTFVIDVISLIPYELFAEGFALLKILRVVHLKDLSNSLERLTNNITRYFIKGLQSIVIGNFFAKFLSVFFQLLITFHLCTCIWIFLGYPAEVGETTWMSAILRFNQDNEPLNVDEKSFEVYIASIFHVIQTMTTIGYGNLPGYSGKEHIFSLGILFFGLIIFSYIFEKVKLVIVSINKADQLKEKKAQDLRTWLNMIERNVIDNLDVVNTTLLDSAKILLEHKVKQDWHELFAKNQQFKHLGYNMQTIVLKAAFKQFQEKFYLLSKGLSRNFLHQIFISSESRIYLSGETIVSKGSLSKGLFLILEGSVLIARNSPDQAFTKLPENSFFGETFLLARKQSRFYYTACGDVSCLFVGQEVFEKMGTEYTKDIKALRALAFYRQSHLLKDKEKWLKIEDNSKVGAESKTEKSTKVQLQSQSTIAEHHKKNVIEEVCGTNKKKKNTNETLIITNEELDSPGKKKNAIPQAVRKLLENNYLVNESLDTESFDNIEEISKIDFSEKETIQKENYQTTKENDREEISDTDELNRSDIYPIEAKIPDFTDPSKSEEIYSYLEERLDYLHIKLDHMKIKLNEHVRYISQKMKIINKKSSYL